MVVNFLRTDWQPKHVIIRLFEAIETTKQVLAKNLTKFLDTYGLRKKIITYVKDEGSNLNSMTIALKLVMNCETLELEECYQGNCIGRAFFKACQYVTNDEKATSESMVERTRDENFNLDIF